MYTIVELTNGEEAVISLVGAKDFSQATKTRKLNSGGAYVVEDFNTDDETEFVDLSDVSKRLQEMMQHVDSQFVNRGELIKAFVLGVVSGEHTFVLSPPGTAKTAVATQLTKCMDVNLWRTLLNPDLTRDSLVGMTDPFEFAKGKWTRRWAGIATHDIVVLDEIWKSSGQVANILLDVLEERRVREGDDELHIPLLSALAMSNEVPEEDGSKAIYDRFLIRLSVDYMAEASQFEAMLTASSTTSSKHKQFVNIKELRLLAAAAELLALDPPKSVMDTIKKLWVDMKNAGMTVSDRRWRKTLKLAMANSLLYDRKASPLDMSVAKWTLWSEPEDEKEIAKMVLSQCDPFTGKILDMKALYMAAIDLNANIEPGKFDQMAEAAQKNGSLLKALEELSKEPGIDPHLGEIESMITHTEQLQHDLMRANF